jgi:hypothetical protein
MIAIIVGENMGIISNKTMDPNTPLVEIESRVTYSYKNVQD